MPRTKDAQQLHDLVAAAIARRGGAPRHKPMLIADEVMRRLDGEERSHPLVWIGCHLEIRQIARGMLAKHYDPVEADDDEDDDPTLPFINFQRYYPEAPKDGVVEPDGPAYILRDLMTTEDVVWNANRLWAEARTKAAHGDALMAWDASRRGAA